MAVVVIDTSDKAIKKIEANIKKTLESIGLYVTGEAKKRSPIDTGNLRGSITHETDMQEEKVRIGTNVEYAPYMEFGTGIYAENGKGRKTSWTYRNRQGQVVVTNGSKAQPFLRPAIEENIEIIRIIAIQNMKISE